MPNRFTKGHGLFGKVTAKVLTLVTSLLPSVSGGADLGSAAKEWGDIYIADDKQIKFGNDQDASIEYDETTLDALKIIGEVVFADGTDDVDIASHDGTNGLKLGGTLLTATATELNLTDGLTATTAELNTMAGITATTAELNTAADLSAQGALLRVKKLAITSAPDGSEEDTTFNIPTKSVVLDALVDVTTAESTGGTKTLDVGLLSGESGGDANGFLDGISVAATGIIKGVFAQTTGSNNNFVGAAATHTLGELLTNLLIAGEDIAAGGDGVAVKGSHVSNGTAVSVTYTAGSNDWVEFRGDIYLIYMEIG